MKKAVINVDKTNPLPVLTDSVTRVSIQCTAKDENGAGIEVNMSTPRFLTVICHFHAR